MTLDARERSRNSGNPVECYRIQLGLTVWRVTSADLRLTIDVAGEGVRAYVPEAISRGDLSFSEEQNSGVVEVSLPRWHEVAQLFIAITPSQPVRITIYRFHPDDGEIGIAFMGQIVAATFEGSTAKLTCAPGSVDLRRSIPRLPCQVRCPWTLFSAGCGLNAEDFREDGVLTSVAGDTLQAAVFATQPDGYFTLGYIQLADATRRYITAHLGNTVTLQEPAIGLVAGTAIAAYPGCDLLETTCVAKFNNLANHWGFRRLPVRNPYQVGLS